MLLAAGADQDSAANDGTTALHLATENADIKIVQLLLAAGADKNRAANNGNTALHIAATVGLPEVVQLLLAAGADENKEGMFRTKPFYWAAANGNTAVMQLLLKSTIHMTRAEVMEALDAAAMFGHRKAVQLLLNACTGHLRSKDIRAAFLSAVRNGNLEIMVALLKAWERHQIARHRNETAEVATRSRCSGKGMTTSAITIAAPHTFGDWKCT